jgi:multidrug efflux pump subunit AcrB
MRRDVSSVTGAPVPLKLIAAVEPRAAAMSIDHFNLERTVTLTADVIGDACPLSC